MSEIKLPLKKIFETPRLLTADAYTIGSFDFESQEAMDKSIYYVTFRKTLNQINSTLYNKNDNRIIFVGLGRILNYLFRVPITHKEIDETKEFLKFARVGTDGFHPYTFPEEIWRKVVDEFNGRPPIKITALREGSVCYPNEPIIQIESRCKGMGILAAWFESKLLQVWSSSEMVTQLVHWKQHCEEIVRKVYGDTESEETISLNASLMLHNFGDRAGICPQESEWLGNDALYVFGGTDTFAGAYQAWKNGHNSVYEQGIFSSVKALAHRNVQGFVKEFDSYRALYDSMENNSIGSFVSDCYDFWHANEGDGTGKDGSLLSLALESKRTRNGKIVVSRPDSGKAVDEIMWLCRLALKHGLFEEKEINGKIWRFGTYLKFIEGDGMTWEEMTSIMNEMMEQGFAPFGWGLFGVGGGLRNNLKRDNFSAKYALCAVGEKNRPVVKFSETLGKTTLPGPFRLLRNPNALFNKQTIVFANENVGIIPNENFLETYFDGSNILDPFNLKNYYPDDFYGEISPMEDSFQVIKSRINSQFKFMPKTLSTIENHNYPASDKMRKVRKELLKKYAPKKLVQNY